MSHRALRPLVELSESHAPGRLRQGIAGEGDFRWVAVELQGPLERMRRRFDLSPLAAVALGRSLTAAALLLRFLTRQKGRIRLEIKGDGALGEIIAEVDSNGMVRGIVGNLQCSSDDGGLEVGKAVGKGIFRVTQEWHGNRPHVAQVALVNGEIGTDLVHYLEQSEQIHSAALIGVLPIAEGIGAAGGFLIEALPGADENRLQRLETNIAALSSVSHLLREGGVEALQTAILAGLDVEELGSEGLFYGCECSRQDLLQRLLTLPGEDLETLWEETGTCEVVCSLCNGSFHFSEDELKIN